MDTLTPRDICCCKLTAIKRCGSQRRTSLATMDQTTTLAILLTGVLAIVASAVGQLVAGALTNRRAREERFIAAKRELYLKALHQVSAPEEPDLAGMHMRMGASLALFDSRVATAYIAAADAKFAWDREMLERFDRVEEAALKKLRAKWLKGESNHELDEAIRKVVSDWISVSIRTGEFDVTSPTAVAWGQAFIALGRAMQESLGLDGDFSWASETGIRKGER